MFLNKSNKQKIQLALKRNEKLDTEVSKTEQSENLMLTKNDGFVLAIYTGVSVH